MFSALALIAAASSPCTFRPQLQLIPAVSRVRIARTARSFSADAGLSLSIRTVKKAAIPDDPGLRAHVSGYYFIARSLAQASTLRAFGSSPSQARAHLDRAVAALRRDVNMEYARQARIYDTVTENGRAQSQGPAYGFAGGPNASVSCMR